MIDMTAPVAPAQKQLILCADDFAVHASASQGIAQLAAQGRLSATSAMVLSPRWAQDVALLRDLRDHLDVGLHLDWTSSFALQRGHGLSLPRAMWRSLMGGFDPVAARVVIEQQLDAFEAQWQAPPDFVDGHQHVQQFAGIRQALVAALHSRYGAQAQRPYLRISRAPAALADTKSRVIAALGASPLEALARQAQLPTATALLGIYDFAGDAARYAHLMQDWLQAAPPGSLLMCHPARALPSAEYADTPDTPDTPDVIGAARTREFAYLGSAAFAADLARAGVTLARGKTIFSNFGSPT